MAELNTRWVHGRQCFGIEPGSAKHWRKLAADLTDNLLTNSEEKDNGCYAMCSLVDRYPLTKLWSVTSWKTIIFMKIYEICGFQSSEGSYCGLLGYDSMKPCKWVPKLQRNIMSPSQNEVFLSRFRVKTEQISVSAAATASIIGDWRGEWHPWWWRQWELWERWKWIVSWSGW